MPVYILQLAGCERVMRFAFDLARTSSVEKAHRVCNHCHGEPSAGHGGGQQPRAVELDYIEQAVGDGPCITALRLRSPVVIDDFTRDQRWPKLNRKLAEANIHSAIGVPLEISSDCQGRVELLRLQAGRLHP
ncbi:GAF domain-containing protein [Arthrobacter sp. SD76]|uniref:GAF domain-containing protein n=1 Tax=Arthrobacter sp. SD76 TaxID=3415007 RepID=UPI003C784B35